MSWSNIVPMPNLPLHSQSILACFCSVLSTEKWRVRQAARPRKQPARPPDALIQDGPLRASMHPQLLRAKAGFTDTVSAVLASDIYTICLRATQHSPAFSSVVVTPNICHLVGALITVEPVDPFFFFFSPKRVVPVLIWASTLPYPLIYQNLQMFSSCSFMYLKFSCKFFCFVFYSS